MSERGPDRSARADQTARAYTTSALPSTSARALAFVAILVAGLCGGLIGWSVVDLQCGPSKSSNPGVAVSTSHDSGCTAWSAVGAFVGAVFAAGGVGIVSVLVLRAMAEWRRTLEVEELPRRPSPPGRAPPAG
ncbi:MAG TPA: hypothetical protein VGH94_03225 [Acidimicrobiales bacterium]